MIEPIQAALRVEDWKTAGAAQVADTDLPEVVAFDPELDDLIEDAPCGCVGVPREED